MNAHTYLLYFILNADSSYIWSLHVTLDTVTLTRVLHSICSTPLVRMATPPVPVGATEVIRDNVFEELLQDVIPFIASQGPGSTMCYEDLARERFHFHLWCYSCSDNGDYGPDERDRGAHHGYCDECVALRTFVVLSRRWKTFCWENLPRPLEWP